MPHESPTMTKVSREAPFPLLLGRADLPSLASPAALCISLPHISFPALLLPAHTSDRKFSAAYLAFFHRSTAAPLVLQTCYTGPGDAINTLTSLTVLAPKARGADNPVREGKNIRTVSPHCHRPPAATKYPSRFLSPQLAVLPTHYGGNLSDFSQVSAVTSASVVFPPCLLVGSLYCHKLPPHLSALQYLPAC